MTLQQGWQKRWWLKPGFNEHKAVLIGKLLRLLIGHIPLNTMSYYIPWNSLTYFIIPFQYFQTHGFFFCQTIESQNSLYLSLQVWLVANKKDHSVWVGQVASICQPGREVVVCWSERRDDRNKKWKVSPPSDVINKKSPSSTSVVWPCHSPKPLRLIDLFAEQGQ